MSFLARSFHGLRRVSRMAMIQHSQRRAYSEMSFTFASPAEVFYEEAKVKQIDVPSQSGNFGILADHVPTIGALKPGVVNVVEEDGSAKRFFVSSGTVTVNDDSSVQILAEEAAPIDRLDVHAARDGLTKAQGEMTSAQSDTGKVEAQIAVECYEAMIKACEEK